MKLVKKLQIKTGFVISIIPDIILNKNFSVTFPTHVLKLVSYKNTY